MAARFGFRMIDRSARDDCIELRLRLLNRHSLLESANRLQEHRPSILAQRLTHRAGQRRPQARALWKLEFTRHHANHRKASSAKRDHSANDRVTVEAFTPKTVAENHNR